MKTNYNETTKDEYRDPSEWNPGEEYFEEWEAEFAIATTHEGWAEIEKERERLYLEELEIRKRRGSEV